MSKKYSAKDLGKDFFNPLIEKACQLIVPKKIILFGSFARGDAHEKSDIDLAFEFEEEFPNWSEFRQWVDSGFETLRKVDLVNTKLASKNLLESIKREGLVIYEQKNH